MNLPMTSRLSRRSKTETSFNQKQNLPEGYAFGLFCAVFWDFYGSLGSALVGENRQSESALARFWRCFAGFWGDFCLFRAFFADYARFQPIFAGSLGFRAIFADFEHFSGFFARFFGNFGSSLGSALVDENRQSESALARFWRRFAIFSGNFCLFRAFFADFARFQPIFADLLDFRAIFADFEHFSGFFARFFGNFPALWAAL